MNLPGLDQLSALGPDFARAAAQLGQAAWTNPARTPRETTAAFLGADLALGLLDLPLTLHTTMARQEGIPWSYLASIITHLAPHIGYPQAAQALTAIAADRATDVTSVPHPVTTDYATPDSTPTDRELQHALDAATRLLDPDRSTAMEQTGTNIEDILTEYGLLRTRRTSQPEDTHAQPRTLTSSDTATAPLPPSFDVCQSDERVMLLTFLDEHRAAAVATLDELSDGEARRSLVPSATTLLGLIKHLTLVEPIWFTELLTGHSRAELGLPATPADSFQLDPADTVDSIRTGYQQACARSRDAVNGHDLDEVITGHRFGPMTLRWILLHCIRETAQHVGHAEILHEQTKAERA